VNRHPLSAMFAPKSVALVGASERPGSVGHAVLESLHSGGFKGRVEYVNPRHATIAGAPCAPTLEALAEPVDLAIVASPAASVPQVIAQAGRAGVPNLVVLSAGFGEAGDAGRKLQDEALAAAHAAKVRFIGPNCVGLMRPSIGLNASFSSTAAPAGGIALVSQSGAICTSLVDWAAAASVGLSSVVSLGAAADIDFGEVLEYLLFDGATHSVLLYIEGVQDGRRFMSSLRALARAKPVIVLKVGRHDEGSHAARSHTGALVGDDMVFDAVLARSGAVRVEGYRHLFAAARALVMHRKPAGPRLAIVTNGGGPGALAADAAAQAHVPLATLSPATLSALDAALPRHWSHGNPVDVIGDANGERFAAAAAAVANDPAVDGIVTVFCPTGLASADDVADRLIPVANASYKPFLTAWLGQASVQGARERAEHAGIPSYRVAEVAVEAFAMTADWVRRQRLLLEAPPARAAEREPDGGLPEEIFRTAQAEGRTLLSEFESKRLLAHFGIPVPPFAVARTLEEAKAAAERIGFPVAVKVLSRDITHKSDVNGVRLNVRTPAAIELVWNGIAADVKRLRPDARFEGVVVQAMVDRRYGRELLLGVKTDPVFGPAIIFGSGGVAVELLRDSAVALPPLNGLLAGDLVDRTRASCLLAAYRNVPAANRPALIDAILRVSDMVCELPWIAELDVNPLLVDDTGATALDARVIVDFSKPRRDFRYSHLAIHPYPMDLERVERLKDGTAVLLRPIRPEDAPMHAAFIAGLSDESRYLRFFAPIREATPEMIARLTQIDYDRDMALVAVSDEGSGRERIIGAVRYARDPDPRTAEFAVVVADRWQGKGLASSMMERLMQHARSVGIEDLSGSVIARNSSMLELMHHLGFRTEAMPDDGMVVLASRKL
jgi:acetyltransferase